MHIYIYGHGPFYGAGKWPDTCPSRHILSTAPVARHPPKVGIPSVHTLFLFGVASLEHRPSKSARGHMYVICLRHTRTQRVCVCIYTYGGVYFVRDTQVGLGRAPSVGNSSPPRRPLVARSSALVGRCSVGSASIWARKLHGPISEKFRLGPHPVTFCKDILLHVILASKNFDILFPHVCDVFVCSRVGDFLVG